MVHDPQRASTERPRIHSAYEKRDEDRFHVMNALHRVWLLIGWSAMMADEPAQSVNVVTRCVDESVKTPHIILARLDAGIVGLAIAIRKTLRLIELWRNLGDGVNQAADISWLATSIPSRNVTPRTILGN